LVVGAFVDGALLVGAAEGDVVVGSSAAHMLITKQTRTKIRKIDFIEGFLKDSK